jgi:hypothetical protein
VYLNTLVSYCFYRFFRTGKALKSFKTSFNNRVK